MKRNLIVFVSSLVATYGLDFGWADISPESVVKTQGQTIYFMYDSINKFRLENKLELMYKEILYLRSHVELVQKEKDTLRGLVSDLEKNHDREIFQREQIINLYQDYVKSLNDMVKSNPQNKRGILRFLEDSIKVFGIFKLIDR